MGNSHPHPPRFAPLPNLKSSPLVLLCLGLAAWAIAALLPLRFQALDPRLLTAAGNNTPSLCLLADSLLDSEHLGAGLRLSLLAQSLHLPASDTLVATARSLLSSRQDLAWLGTRDPRLELILATSGLAFEKNSAQPPPALTFLLREPVRLRLRDHLRSNPSPSVQSLLETIPLPPLPPLLPAQSPGGQPLEAILLLTAHLIDTSAFTSAVAGDVKALTQASLHQHSLRPLQPCLLSLLSLSRRFDYDSLRQILGTVDSLPALHWVADQIRSPAEPADLLLVASLWAGPASRLALLPLPPTDPWGPLSHAISLGRGAVDLLLQRHCPVLTSFLPFPLEFFPFLLRWEKPLLFVRALLFLLSAWLIILGLWRWLPNFSPLHPGPWRLAPRLIQTALLAFLLGAALEPAWLRPNPLPRYRLSLALPTVSAKNKPLKGNAMDPTNLITLAVFLGLQIAVYRVCLRRLRQIENGPGDPQLKLRLLENEDNLFDAGLYIGIAGTATALVLQVIGLIQPSLLAAYASNLFGIAGVAIVKIFHLRALKQRLLLPPDKN